MALPSGREAFVEGFPTMAPPQVARPSRRGFPTMALAAGREVFVGAFFQSALRA